jgi:sugar phosphate isomerase/epimerase
MSIPIGLQLYSVRKDAEQDLLGTIAKVAEQGYQGVEFAGTFGVSASDIARTLEAAGISSPSAHVAWNLLTDDKIKETTDFYGEFGCKGMVIPWIPEEKRNTDAASRETAAELSDLVAKLEELGFWTGFHAHDGDMKPLDQGRSAWDLIGSYTPASFAMQYDTGNGMSGGADPVAPINLFPGKGRSIHLKEYPFEGAPIIGEGLVPWKEVFAACEAGAGTEWYIVEYEAEGPFSALDAVDKCLQYLRSLGK